MNDSPTRKRKKGKKRRKAKPQPVFLEHSELLALLKAAHDHSFMHWLFLVITYWHGLRVSETISIRRQDIKDGFLVVQRLKGSWKTTQELVRHDNPLLDEANGVALFLNNRRKGSDRIFAFTRRTADRFIKHYGQIAEIPAHKRHMHVLKHSRGKHFIASTGLEGVQAALGHVNIQNTQVYARLSDAEADQKLKAALAKP